jgi:hypothetical protein
MVGFSPGERAAINYFQEQYNDDSADATISGSLATAGVFLMYDFHLRGGRKVTQGHIEFEGKNNDASNKSHPASATFEDDHPIGRTAFQKSLTGTWDYDDDDDATDGYILFDNGGDTPNLDYGYWGRVVIDTHRKRRANGSNYIPTNKDSVWWLHIFKCEGACRWNVRSDGGSVEFSTKDIDQDFSSGANAGTAQALSYKVPFVYSGRYICMTVIKENETTSRGRLKFMVGHPNYYSRNTSTGYDYDVIDDSNVFALS